jgi:hypothetical protein
MAMHDLDKAIDSIEKIMRLMWDMLPEKEQALLAHAYAFALIRRIANKGMERS